MTELNLSAVPFTPYYDRDGITIYNADCLTIIDHFTGVDFVLTDPPYLLPGMKGAGCFGGRPSLVGTQGFTDMGFDASILSRWPNWACFCSKNNLSDLIAVAGTKSWNLIHWCKPNPVPTCNGKYLGDVELCVHKWSKGRLFGEMKHKSSFFIHPVGDKETSHPNEKPLKLMRKLVTTGTKLGDIILDPFMGSGTTLVAAKLEGRRAVGIEINEKYCEIAVQRLKQKVMVFE